MFSLSLRVTVFLIVLCAVAAAENATEFRVCADPDNLPFSNRAEQGFENKIAVLIAQELHVRLSYVWQRMGRGFVREFLDNSACDVLIGVPTDFRAVLTTDPYYRSSYTFVTRTDRHLRNIALDDPQLRTMKIGVQVLEENYAPPATALVRHGLQNEIVGFDTTGENPGEIVDAVAAKKIDMAIVWGPFAGFFAKKYGDALNLSPMEAQPDLPHVPFTYSISMAVRKGNLQLHDKLEEVLSRKSGEIQDILKQYGVPIVHSSAQTGAGR